MHVVLSSQKSGRLKDPALLGVDRVSGQAYHEQGTNEEQEHSKSVLPSEAKVDTLLCTEMPYCVDGFSSG